MASEIIALEKKGLLLDYKTAAQTFFSADSFENAIRYGKNHLQRYPKDTETVFIVAQSLDWSQKGDEALKYYEKYFEYGGRRRARHLYQYASCIKNKGEYEKALKILLEAKFKTAPGEKKTIADIDLAIVQCVFNADTKNSAIEYFSGLAKWMAEKSPEIDAAKLTETNIALFNRGKLKDFKSAARCAFMAGSFEVAINFARRHISDAGTDTETAMLAAKSLMWTSKAAEAITYWNSYFKKGGARDAETLYLFAECLRASGAFEEAAARYYEARSIAPGGSGLPERIALGEGYANLEISRYGRAFSCFKKARGSKLNAQYLEAMGDYYQKIYSVSTVETYFDADKFAFVRKEKSTAECNLAYDYYRRSLFLKPENEAIKVKIASCMWELNKREGAIELLEKIEQPLNMAYASARLAYFLKERRKTDAGSLNRAIRLMDRAAALGMATAEVEYEKACLYESLHETSGVDISLSRAAALASGAEWFILPVIEKCIDYRITDEALLELSKKCEKIESNKKIAIIIKAYFYSRTARFNMKSALALDEFFRAGKIQASEIALVNLAKKIFDSLSKDVQLVNSDISETIANISAQYAHEEIESRILAAGSLINNESDEAKLTRYYEARSDMFLSDLRPREAAADILKPLKFSAVEKNALKSQELLLKAYKYLNYASDYTGAVEIAKKLFDRAYYGEEILNALVNRYFWSEEKGGCRKYLDKLKEKYPVSASALLFSGVELSEKNLNRAALELYKKSLAAGGDKKFLDLKIEESRQKLKRTFNFDPCYNGDSGSQTKRGAALSFSVPEDGYVYNAGADSFIMEKSGALSGVDAARTKTSNIYVQAVRKLPDSDLSVKISSNRANGEYFDSISKIFPEIGYQKYKADKTFSLNYSQKLMTDTPISSALALTQKTFLASAYFTKFRHDIFASYQRNDISDGNSRNIYSGAISRKMKKGWAVKYSYALDDMRRGYEGPLTLGGETFSPYEAYYSPSKVGSHGLGLDYSLKLKKANIALSSVLYGKETRLNGPDSKFQNLSAAIEWSIDAITGIILNFFGVKSDINPYTDSASNSKYIGRELYLKYYYKM